MKTRNVNHIRWGVVLTYVTLFANIVLSILYTPVMLRILGPAEHGLYSTVSSTMAWLSLLGLGIGNSYIRYFSKYKKENRDDSIASLNGLFIAIFTVIGIVALACGLFISNNLHLLFSDKLTDEQYNLARILSIIVTVDFAVSFPASVFGSVIRANEKFIQAKIINLFQTVTSPLVTLPLLYMGYGSIGMVTVTTCVDIIAYAVNAFYCFKKLGIKVRFGGFEKGIGKDIASFSVFIVINMVISQVNANLDKILLTRFVGPVSASVYTIGYSLYIYYASFSGAVSGMFVPRIYKITNQFYEDKQKLRTQLTEQFVKLGRIQFYIQMLMLSGMVFFGRQFIAMWAGAGYENSYYVAVILCGACTISLCQNIGVEIQRAQNKHRFRSIFYSIMTAVNVALTVVLCQLYGEIGATVGTAISVVAIDIIVMNVYYHKKLYVNVLAFWKNIARISLGLIVPVAVGITLNIFVPMNTIPTLGAFIIIYTLLYCASMWFISMNAEEKEMIGGKIKSKLKKGRS